MKRKKLKRIVEQKKPKAEIIKGIKNTASFLVDRLEKGEKISVCSIRRREKDLGLERDSLMGLVLKECMLRDNLGMGSVDSLFKGLEKEGRKNFAKEKRLENITEYKEHLAKEKGFKTLHEYNEHLAKERGFKNYTEYAKHLAKEKGFKTIYEERSFKRTNKFARLMRAFMKIGFSAEKAEGMAYGRYYMPKYGKSQLNRKEIEKASRVARENADVPLLAAGKSKKSK